MFMWLLMSFVLSAAYVFEILKGAKTVTYYLIMEVFAWGPIIVGFIVLKVRGWHTRAYRDICAGGYAFSCKGEDFSSLIGEIVEIEINEFELLQDKVLPGTVIRSSNDNGTYIVGCRMLEDNEQIGEYVKEKM